MQELLAERIRRQGPLPFSVFMEAALYDSAGGFYATGGGAGRRRDFLTSPEVGPLFGAVVARALDQWWETLGRPDPFVVIEAGAGAGTLARDVLAAGPRCAPALRYLLVERAASLRDAQVGQLTLELPAFVLGPTAGATPAPAGAAAPPAGVTAPTAGVEVDDDGEPHPERNRGPLAASLVDFPAGPYVGLVLANELLDNLACDLMERGPAGWQEVRVGLADDRGTGLTEVLVPAAPRLAAAAEALVADASVGARLPLQHDARSWLRQALSVLERGAVIVWDYARRTPAMAGLPQEQWLRTYRSHGRGGPPLSAPGAQDITCDAAIDQLADTAPPAVEESQTTWLERHGLPDLVAEAERQWQAQAAAGGLDALKARSRLSERAALTDPAGLGGFTVLEWHVGLPAPARQPRL